MRIVEVETIDTVRDPKPTWMLILFIILNMMRIIVRIVISNEPSCDKDGGSQGHVEAAKEQVWHWEVDDEDRCRVSHLMIIVVMNKSYDDWWYFMRIIQDTKKVSL